MAEALWGSERRMVGESDKVQIRYSRHALDQMRERKVPREAVEWVLEHYDMP